MKKFDLYRIALGYLGVIFVLCAVVVFNPLRWFASDKVALAGAPSQGPADLPVTVAAGADTTRSNSQPPVQTDSLQQMSLAALAGLRARGAPQAAGPDTAQVLAGIVAQSEEVELGEGDAPTQADVVVSPEAALVAGGADVTYTVAVGDSLGALALRFYGDSALASAIFDANRGLMGSPDRLRVGQVLIIPGRS